MNGSRRDRSHLSGSKTNPSTERNTGGKLGAVQRKILTPAHAKTKLEGFGLLLPKRTGWCSCGLPSGITQGYPGGNATRDQGLNRNDGGDGGGVVHGTPKDITGPDPMAAMGYDDHHLTTVAMSQNTAEAL